ncbi:DNA primase [Leptospira sp. GIMC2001]|uniref:DNA primase n=1 Tax=Leptospira sp. GIMC2001 TaxID=1513297 RepID=UPI0004A5C676|nr:DNA primase [Leptospira sp. GIMC2001]AID56278.1 DNA primase [Leptospira sp. GIMC2001]WCL48144.1 DNA primase [Leptospira sp. GIMC2001]
MSGSDFKERVRREVPIESYISRFIPLKKAGKNYLGLCPFHNEKTPSFNVNSQGGYYHCFGCKASGDIFRFVMDYNKVDFVRSMEILSEASGIPLTSGKSPEDNERNKRKEEAYRINQKANEFFVSCLHSQAGKQALDYLLGRGLSLDEIKKFDIGYALEGFQNLRPDILRTSFDEELGIELGLLKKNEKGNIYDFYRNRVMFPIRDSSGRFVGFSGRTLSTDTVEAKYINSPNSIVYDKGRQVFNLYLASEEIRNLRTVYLVEGVMDAIGLYTKGVQNVLAPLGTSFTENQSKILKNLADKVYLVMDGDAAGKKGALRASEILLKDGLPTEVVFLDQGVDPFELSRSKNKAEIRNVLESGRSGWDFLVAEALLGADASSEPELKKKGIRSLFQFTKKWEKETDRQLFLTEGAKKIGLTYQALLNDFRMEKEQFAPAVSDNQTRTQRNIATNRPIKKGAVECERTLLAKLVIYPDLFRFAHRLDELVFLDETSVIVWEWLYTQFHMGEAITPAEFLSAESLPEKIRESLAPFLMQEEIADEEDQGIVFEELIMAQRKFFHENEMNKYYMFPSMSEGDFESISQITYHKNEIEKINSYFRKHSHQTMRK